MAVGDRQDDRLHRRQPGREAARVVLDQDPGEALHRAEQGAVDHHRPVGIVVGAGVGEVEALRHLEVELAGAALPGAAERVGDVEVDLRPVEGTVAGVQLVLAALAVERLGSAASAFAHCSSVPIDLSGRVESSTFTSSKPKRA